MQLHKVIEQLGYSAKEAKVYLAALSLGEAHITDIASKAQLPRSSVQLIVDTLHRDGLMNFYVQRRYKYWAAENPERLLALFRRREETLREALPQLLALRRINRNAARERNSRLLGMLRVFANDASEPVLIADRDANILYVNASWEEEFGYSLDEVTGKSTHILRSGKTPRALYDAMWGALEEGRIFQSELIDMRKNGSECKIRTTIIPLDSGNERFYVQVLDDISDPRGR